MEELEKNETSTQAEENTVSLASAQALADALAKIEAYTPTTWVDNSSPDIDAEHLNKPEQAIKRVTDALNSAVDVIKDLQSQVTKNAGDISTVNNNLSKCLQYIHSETDVFDFNDPKTPAGYHRLGAAASYKNAPSGLDGVNFCTVEVVRPTISDTLAMTIYPYKKGINPPVWYKSGGSNEWSTLPWNVYATKSDLSNMTKKDSSKFMPGDTVLDVSAWSAITLLSIVTYKDEATALYLIRKESSNKIYCIPVKSSTQVSVTHNGENKLTLSNSATYGGTWVVLFLS